MEGGVDGFGGSLEQNIFGDVVWALTLTMSLIIEDRQFVKD